jgi:hypothetical protein
MKFLCLAYEEERKLNDLTKAEWDQLRGETLAYVEVLRKHGHLVATHALQSARTAATVRIRQGARSVSDGPFAETKESRWRRSGRRPASAPSRCARSRKRSGRIAATEWNRPAEAWPALARLRRVRSGRRPAR